MNIWEEIDQERIKHWVEVLKDVKPGDGSPGYSEQTGDGTHYTLEIGRHDDGEWSVSAYEHSSCHFDYFILYMAEPHRSDWQGNWHADAHGMIDRMNEDDAPSASTNAYEDDAYASAYEDIVGYGIERDLATAMDRLAESKTDMEGLSFDVSGTDEYGIHDIDAGGSAEGDASLEEVARLVIKVEDALDSVVDDYGPGLYAASWDALSADQKERMTELVRKYQEAHQQKVA